MRIYSLFVVLCCFTCIGLSQNTSSFGKFNNRFYSIDDFGSGAQIWTGDQGRDGNVYFGNDEEILCFNGVEWSKVKCDTAKIGLKKIELINKTTVSKIYTAKNGITYVGRKNNFGYLEYSKKGRIVYHPLFVSADESGIGQIWQIFETENQEIVFIAKNKVFTYKNDVVKSYKPQLDLKDYTCNTAGYLGDGALLVYTPNDSDKAKKYVFYEFATNDLKEISLPGYIDPFSIRGTIKINNTWHLFTSAGQVLKLQVSGSRLNWQQDQSRFQQALTGMEINAVKMHNKYVYVATELSGIMILDINGNLIRVINLLDELASISVFDFFHDNENNLWINLDNGVHFFETSSPLTYFDKDDGVTARTERFDFSNGNVYLGNNIDIFESYQENYHKKFKNLKLLNEAVFDNKTYQTSFGPKTLVIGYSGIYEVDYAKHKSQKIVEEYAWKTFQNPINKDEFFVGLEKSLGLLKLSKSGWSYETIIPDVNGNIISLAHVKGKLVFGAENIGVYVYDLRTKKYSVIKVDDKKSIQTSYYVESFRGKIYVGLEGGIYTLSSDFKKLEPFKVLKKKFFTGNSKFQVHRILNQDNKRLWVVTHNENNNEFEQGWLELKKENFFSKNQGEWTWTAWPFVLINIKKDGLAYDIRKGFNDDVWLSTNKNIYLFNPDAVLDIQKSFGLSIDEIRVNNKPYLFNPFYAKPIDALKYENNTLKFTFHAKSFMGLSEMRYRFKLDNYSEWSDWSDLNFAEFQKLFEGNYRLKVQARNCYGFMSETMTYDFQILAPWYRTWWAYTIYVISFIILIYIIIQLSIQRVKNQNIKLEGIVKERTKEIAAQNDLLEIQKEEITQKTKDIVDSIVYAKRIQETILPTERLPQMLPKHFVFYRPKDIVSGDFYWARQKGSKIIFSAIDCTGHGVPGALVSIVGNSALLRCVNEHKLTEPAEILDKLRDIVIRSFDSTGQQDVKDGMDMSLCTLDTDTMILKYAGANNECVIIRNKELIELKADKQPIGQFAYATPFKQQEIQLQDGDCIYQFTDGYIDQFGGEKGKKLKSRPFKEMLLSVSHLPMEEQLELVRKFFEDWKSGYEQVDDVCVFGVKI